MRRQTLIDSAWTCRLLRASDDTPVTFPSTPIPGTVPGCIHTDLIRAGLLGHPNIADNEERTQWVGRCDWQYRCELHVESGILDCERIDLVCHGLDTIASIAVNGVVVGQAANQFHPHRFDIRRVIRVGTNELTIDFASPVEHIRAEATRLGPRPVNGDWDPYVFIRKSACNFGWDWGPKVATVGVIGGVDIEAWNTVRIADVRPLIFREADGSWRVKLDVRIEGTGRSDVEPEPRMTALRPKCLNLKSEISDPLTPGSPPVAEQKLTLVANDLPAGASDVTISMTARGISPWMPRGHGPARLYHLDLALFDENGTLIDKTARRIGFRTVALDTSPDEHGSRFTIRVNDNPIFVLGANWIPEGLFPGDRTPARIRERIQQAADANLNLLRVWGGGAYESEAFYEACDELGILVWQDFMFACACYPEEEPIRTQVEAEARYQIARLSSHPSVVLWCGGNECIWAWQGWGFAKRLQPDQTWGRGYWLDLLPRLCNELDPTRPYWPNTPWSCSLDADVQDPNHGTRHTWDKRAEGYREIAPRFIAEFGHQSPPNYSTIQESLGNQPIETWLRDRQRASGGNSERYDKPLAEHFAPARDFDEWLYQAHLLQARAITLGIEWARIHRDRGGGAIFWQLNDAWPGHSWSAIDSAGRRKPLWYAVRRACASQLLTIQPQQGRTRLFGVDDAAESWTGTLLARRVRFDGAVQATVEIPYCVEAARAAMLLDLDDALGSPADSLREFLVIDDKGETGQRAMWFFDSDKRLVYNPPRATARIETKADAVTLHIVAETMIRDLVFGGDRVWPDAHVSDQLVTLLPGESATLVVTCPSLNAANLAAAGEALLSPQVLRCINGPLIMTRA